MDALGGTGERSDALAGPCRFRAIEFFLGTDINPVPIERVSRNLPHIDKPLDEATSAVSFVTTIEELPNKPDILRSQQVA